MLGEVGHSTESTSGQVLFSAAVTERRSLTAVEVESVETVQYGNAFEGKLFACTQDVGMETCVMLEPIDILITAIIRAEIGPIDGLACVGKADFVFRI